MESDGTGSTTIPLHEDIWSVIMSYTHLYDTIFLRATSKWFYKACKKYQPFPKYHVLDQDKCTAYLIEISSTSCLEYLKNALRFEWTEEHCASAARSGEVDVLKYLRDNGCPINIKTVLLECTKGTCNISVIKYLHETGVPWEQEDPTDECNDGDYYDRNSTKQTVIENMVFHGHLECLKYAVENGCTDRRIFYTPSTECLDYVIANDFDWKGGMGSKLLVMLSAARPVKLSFCEQAAQLGDLTMLKYAYEKGAHLQKSDEMASAKGHLECLKFSFINTPESKRRLPWSCKTLECCKFLLGNEIKKLENTDRWWTAAGTSVEYMKFLKEHNVELPKISFYKKHMLIAATKSLDTCKFAHEVLKLPFKKKHYLACANVEVLQYIKENMTKTEKNKLQDPKTIQAIICEAIQAKDITVLKYIWEQFPNKEGVNLEVCQYHAVNNSTPEIIEFLTQHGAQWTSNHLSIASRSGRLSNMAYLTRIGCEWDDAKCDTKSAMCVKYAKKHGCKQFVTSKQYSLFSVH